MLPEGSLPPPDDDPLTALRAVTSLRRLADALEQQHVEHAITAGHTWAEIADALGVSRQAVHKKHARRIRPHDKESS